MKVHVIRPEELSPQQIQLWSGMMCPEDVTDGPFFHPEYVRTLGRFRKPVRVAVITEYGREVAFFPFEQSGKNGHPLGIKLCDFQGIVRSHGIAIDVRELLAGCGLTRWEFDHVVASQPEFQPWQLRVEGSPYIDLSGGFETYVTQQKQAGRKIIPKINTFRRRAERDIGPVRFEWHSFDPAVFETLLEWKSAQRKQTETFDLLQFEWVRQVLDAIRKIRLDDFGGVLSTLYINDTLAAASLNMKTRSVLHTWFISYNPGFSKYSPGHILSLATIEAAAERGIQRVDLGRGDDSYKKRINSGCMRVGEGAVDLNLFRHLARRLKYQLFSQIRDTRLYEALQGPKRMMRNFLYKQAGTFSE